MKKIEFEKFYNYLCKKRKKKKRKENEKILKKFLQEEVFTFFFFFVCSTKIDILLSIRCFELFKA